MKRTQVMGGLLAAIAIALCSLVGPGDLLAGKGGKGGSGGGGGGSSAPPYQGIQLLGTLGGNGSGANGLNNYGDVVGWSVTGVRGPHGWGHAFLNIDDGTGTGGRTMIDLHDLIESEGWIPPFDYTNGNGWLVNGATDINDSRQIIGTMVQVTNGTAGEGRAYLYTPGTSSDFLDLGVVNANAINTFGDVTGDFFVNGVAHAFVWKYGDGQPTDLGAADAIGNDINDTMQVCGNATFYGSPWRYTFKTGVFEDLGLLSKNDSLSDAYSINNSGKVCGTEKKYLSSGQSTTSAWRYGDTEGLIGLGTLGGQNGRADGINDNGDVVGSSEISHGGDWHLFLYTDQLGLTDLTAAIDSLPSDLAPALDGDHRFHPSINNVGQVCGTAWGGNNPPSLNGNGVEAYLLTPKP